MHPSISRPRTLSKLIIALMLIIILAPYYRTKADETIPADYTIDSSSIEIEADCTKNLLLIKWANSEEPNVTGFKVHSRSTQISSDTIANRWINPIAIAAKGANQQYTVIDASFAPNTLYTLRVYGFEKNNLLSKAKQITINNNFARYCTRLPVAIIQN